LFDACDVQGHDAICGLGAMRTVVPHAKWFSGALVGAALRWLTLAALALSCATTPAQDELQYQRRSNRFEGLQPRPVSGYDIELLSARIDHREDLSRLSERLTLRFYLRRREPVFLVVRELVYRHYYWLDKVEPRVPWQPGFDNVFEWPTGDVMGRLPGLRPTDLGVIARLGKPAPSATESVAPVLMYQGALPTRVEAYLFSFRAREQARLTASIYPEGGTEPVLRQVFPQQLAGRPFTVRWDVARQPQPEGAYRLVLSGYRLDSNEPIHQVVSFLHQPLVTVR
jgi:hypothetical protein